MHKLTRFGTAELLTTAAADYIVKLAAIAIAEKGRFTLCLSGGNTPSNLYLLMATAYYSKQIDWKRVFVFWGDERCVALDSRDNNAFLAKELLLNKVPIPQKNIFTIPVDETPVNAAIYYEATLKIFFKSDKPAFDLILLGIGEDGHTASLFPHTQILHEKKSLVKEVFLADKNLWRVSLTLPIINQAAHRLFLVVGKAKAPVVEIILNGTKNTGMYPAQLVENAEWFVSL